MTTDELISTLNAELNRIVRMGGTNIALTFIMKDGRSIKLEQDHAGKWFKNPEKITDGVLKIAESNEDGITSENLLVDGVYTNRITQQHEIRYIVTDNISDFFYSFDVVTDTPIAEIVTPNDGE